MSSLNCSLANDDRKGHQTNAHVQSNSKSFETRTSTRCFFFFAIFASLHYYQFATDRTRAIFLCRRKNLDLKIFPPKSAEPSTHSEP